VAGRNIYVVQSNPVPGREDEYNEWYTRTHFPEILRVPGMVAAERFVVSDLQRTPPPAPPAFRYIAIYDVEGDPQVMFAGQDSTPRTPSEAIARPTSAHLFTSFGRQVRR
jgi:hypothetical protein